MISDNDLYRLAILLGATAMLLIILYHFLEVNAKEETEEHPPLIKKIIHENRKDTK
ncbi:hypothetical protein HI914_07446 [Erysiphe necator]|nr:hypothetical protein HI914_07446 [Erysiphe necator]